MGWLTIVMLFIYTLACVFLIFVILIQAGDKGGGLSSLGSSSQGLSDALGATGAEKTMNNVTSIAAITFILLAIILSVAISGHNPEQILPDASAVAPPVSDTAPPAPGLPGAVGEGTVTPGGVNMIETTPIDVAPQAPPAAGAADSADAPVAPAAGDQPAPEAPVASPPAGQ